MVFFLNRILRNKRGQTNKYKIAIYYDIDLAYSH